MTRSRACNRLRADDGGVSDIIAVILSVAITVVLAATVYIYMQSVFVAPATDDLDVDVSIEQHGTTGYKVTIMGVDGAANLNDLRYSLKNANTDAFLSYDIDGDGLGDEQHVAMIDDIRTYGDNYRTNPIVYFDYDQDGYLSPGDSIVIDQFMRFSGFDIDTQNGTQPDIRGSLYCARLSLPVGVTEETAMIRGQRLFVFTRYIAPSTDPMAESKVTITIEPSGGGREIKLTGETDNRGYFFASAFVPEDWPTGTSTIRTSIIYNSLLYTRTNGRFFVDDDRELPSGPGLIGAIGSPGWVGYRADQYAYAVDPPAYIDLGFFNTRLNRPQAEVRIAT